MGQGSSSSNLFKSLSSKSRIGSEQELVASTKEVVEMSNSLFEFMYSKFEPNEIWDIALNPDDYVISLTDLIHTQFEVIGYTTNRTASGEIYFKRFRAPKPNPRKVRTLDPLEMTKEEKTEHYKNAKIIAFYFIRIFQIVGTCFEILGTGDKDKNTLLNNEYGIYGKYSTTDSAADGRAILGQRVRIRPLQNRGQYGGGRPDESEVLGPLEFLRNHLETNLSSSDIVNIQPVKKPDYTVYKLTDTDLYVQFKPFQYPLDKNRINASAPEFIIVVKQGETARAYSIPIFITDVAPFTIDATNTLAGLQFIIKENEQGEILNPRDMTDQKNKPRIISIRLSKGTNGVIRYLMDLNNPSKVVLDVMSQASVEIGPLSSPKYYLELILLQHVKIKTRDLRLKFFTPQTERSKQKEEGEEELTTPTGRMKPSDIKSPVIKMAYEDMVKKYTSGLTGGTPLYNKPMPFGKHCIQRAEQLLSPIFSDNTGFPAYTKICKFAAPGVFDAERKTVSLDEYMPTKTLAQLYGKINVNPEDFGKSMDVLRAFVRSKDNETDSGKGDPLGISALSTIGNATEVASLKQALNRLKAAFGIVSETEPNSFKDISMKRPEQECATAESNLLRVEGGNKNGGELLVQDDNLKRQLRDVSKELLAFHVNMSLEISKLLQFIFNIQKDPSGFWIVKGIKDEFMFKGFPALDAVTDQVRELATQYYEGCETRYKRGEQLWKDANQPSTAVAPAVAPAAAPAPAVAPAPPTAGGPP